MSATEFIQKQYSRLPSKWHLIVIRVSIYSLMVGWGAFETGVEGFDSLKDLSTLQVIKLAGSIFMSVGGVWLAFFDQTLSNMPNNNSTQTPQNQQPPPMLGGH